jgi:N-acetylneuraminate synthase
MEKFSNKIVIYGRGPSSIHFNSGNYQEYTSIGINVDNHKGFFFNYVVNTHDSNVSLSKKCMPLNIVDLMAKQQEIFKVGSSIFTLGVLLTFLNNSAKEINGNYDIILVGFDFDGYSADDDIGKRTIVSESQRRIDISSQRNAYRVVKGQCNNLNIFRAGFDFDADFDPRIFYLNSVESKKMYDVEIVAEITTNHHGDTDKLIKLINGAAEAGADSVKFQMRHVESFYTAEKLKEKYFSPYGSTFGEYRHALELDSSQIELIKELTRKLNLGVFFSVLDLKSYKYLSDLGFSRFKLPSTISRKIDFINAVSNDKIEEVVISTGMTDTDYEDFILKTFTNVPKLYLLQCTSSYPTYYKDVNLGVISHYRDLSKVHKNIIPGFSSHDSGSIASMLAVGCGAKMIEKHIKVGINDWSHFDDTALDINTSFIDFVRDVRYAEDLYGSETKYVLSSEHHKY